MRPSSSLFHRHRCSNPVFTAKVITLVTLTTLLLLLARALLPDRGKKNGGDRDDASGDSTISDRRPWAAASFFTIITSLVMLAVRLQVEVAFDERSLLILPVEGNLRKPAHAAQPSLFQRLVYGKQPIILH